VEQQLLKPYEEILTEPVTRSDYEQVLCELIDQFQAERGCLWLEKENAFLYLGDEQLRKDFPFSRQAIDAVLVEGRSFLSFDPKRDPRIEKDSSLAMNLRTCLAASCINAENQVLVVAYFDNDLNSEPFSHQDLRFLKAVLSMVPGAMPVE
jgi:GAF domain-containing protein